MLFPAIALLSVLATFVAAQDISQDDIPQQCNTVCAAVVSLARRCDNENESDAAELACICRAPNANTLLPSCEACVRQFDNDDDDNDRDDSNDVHEVLTRCSFTTTTYNTASVSSLLQSVASSFASASGSPVLTTSGTVVQTISVPASTSVVQQTGAAAVEKGRGVVVGAGVGVLAVVLGM